ncbi:MAG: FAD-dependent oxidoreductase [Actinomycetota bacterium]
MVAKNILVLGGGNGGTIISNKLRRELPEEKWNITVIDGDNRHIYQPGLLMVPFNLDDPRKIVKPRNKFLKPGVNFVQDYALLIDIESKKVTTKRGHVFPYDFLVISTGCSVQPSVDNGLEEAMGGNAFTFYTLDGAIALSKALKSYQGGRLVVNISSLPIKCPVAALEFSFLADWYFKKRGIRDKVDIEFVTPAPGIFAKPRAASVLTKIAEQKNVKVRTNWCLGTVNAQEKWIENIRGDERIEYDLLVSVPSTLGDESIRNSGLGDNKGYIPTDPHTLQAKGHDRIYVLGDASDVPTSKAGSAVHYQANVVARNILSEVNDSAPAPLYDGHAT